MSASVEMPNDPHPPIPIPKGGFTTNEDEARWLEETILMRCRESLANFGINASFNAGTGLYDLFLLSLDSASRRGRAAKGMPDVR